MAALRKLVLNHFEAKAVLVPARDPRQPAVAGICITVAGQYFPQRAVEPDVLVGEIASDFTRISVDQRSISGFFRQSLPEGGVVRVRYGDSQEGELQTRFSAKLVHPLPRDCGQ
jgi:hypothetical protein